MGLRPRLHQANGGALRLDFPRGLSRKLFERADRLEFSERTPKSSTDRGAPETVHPKIHCCLVLWDASAMATQLNFRNHLWAWCPGWGKDGRMNQGRFHAYFPWCVSTRHIPVFSHRKRTQDGQRRSIHERHFLIATVRQPWEPEIACMLQQMRLHQLARTSCRNPRQETSKCRQAEVDKCRPSAFQLDDCGARHPSVAGASWFCGQPSFALLVSRHGWHASPSCRQVNSQICRPCFPSGWRTHLLARETDFGSGFNHLRQSLYYVFTRAGILPGKLQNLLSSVG